MSKPKTVNKSAPNIVLQEKTSFWTEFFNKNQHWIIVALSLLLYANTLTHEYALDDRLMITDNQFTKKGVSGIKEIVTHDAFTGFFGVQKSLVSGGRYRPFTHVMFAIEYQLFGLNPFVGHLINVILFALLSVVLYLILKKLLAPLNRSQWLHLLPFMATVLFVAHPIHTEVVANIKGRDELMSLLGSLFALLFVIRFIETKKISNLIWMFLSFVIALFSKENSITFVAVIPLAMYMFFKPSLKDYLNVMGGLALATILFLIARSMVLGDIMNTQIAPEILNDPFLNVPKSTAIATVIYTWGKYIALLIFPHPLTHDYYPFQIAYFQFSSPIIILLSLGFLSLIFFTVWGAYKKKVWSFAALFALITFSIQANLVFNIGTFMNERFVFAPSIGVAILIALFLYSLINHQKYHRIGVFVLLILLVGYSLKTVTRNTVWKNDRTLFMNDVNVSNNSIKCNVSAGGMAYEMAKSESDPSKKSELLNKSFKYLSKAQQLHPGSFYAWFLMGNAYTEIANWSEALVCFQRAYRINVESVDVQKNVLYVAQKAWVINQYNVSADAYRLLSEMEPQNKEHILMVADAFSHINKIDSAFLIINNVLAQDQKNASALSKKGEIFGRVLNDVTQAEFYLKQAVTINPDNLSANENLGIVYGIKKQFDNSIYYFNQALRIDSTQARIYQNIAGTYKAMGKNDEAERCLKIASTKSEK